MAMTARSYILNRRAGGVADLSTLNLTTGDMTLEEAERFGVYKVNCAHQVGIATASEVGLTGDRFPIRIILGQATRGNMTIDTCISYWKVTNAAGAYCPFNRQPFGDYHAITELYNTFPTLDHDFWLYWRAHGGPATTEDNDAALEANQTEFHGLLLTLQKTDAQKVRLNELLLIIRDACIAGNRVPYYKISDNYFLRAKPHGTSYGALGDFNASKVALLETALCITVNFNRLKARYDDLPEGAVSLASYAIASMFRFGLFEAFEHQEFVTVTVAPVAGQANQFTVTGVAMPPGYAAPTDIVVGNVINIAATKLKKTTVEIGNMLVAVSGLMHYLFNHTTGGNIVTGSLLTTLSMYKIITSEMTTESQEKLTSLFYEALHPTNKRAIANLFFKNSQVTSHGRARGAPRYEELVLDSFMAIRGNPYPAGSHKAFICLTALKRVLQSGLGPFLPWASSLTDCINMAANVLKSGARAHIGSHYYTGEPPVAQPASLDQYMPELAHYVQTFNKNDSLAFSPHLSVEVQARCDMNWKNMLRELRSKDVSATSVETVRSFLATSGAVHYDFDPEKQETWVGASTASRTALEAVKQIFG